MKSNFSSKKRYRRAFMLFLLVVLIFTFSIRGLLTSVTAPIAGPLISISTWISTNVFWWTKANNITINELEALYDQRRQLISDVADLEQIREENAHLKQELSFVERTSLTYVPARILSKSISNTVSRFVIDIGTDQGVRKGSAVIMGEGIFLGKVTQAGKRSSTVTGVTDPTHAVAVSLLNENRTIGVAKGTTGDLLEIDFIPIDERVEENHLVVTSGLESPIPSGLLIGIINTVSQVADSPFQQAIVEPLSDIRRVTSVLVLLNQTEELP